MDLSRVKQSQVDVEYVAVGVCDTGGSLHAGVVHRDNDKVFFLEQCWYEDTRNDPVEQSVERWQGKFLFAVPRLEKERAQNVAGMCRQIAKWLVDGGTIPYALTFDSDARFDRYTGTLVLPNGIGLTCSTFVVTVFRSASVRFIDFEGWPERAEDEEAQERLVGKLARDRRIPREHVEAVKNEIGCVRARPEEVAGVCLLSLPGKFPAAEIAGEAVLSALEELE